LETDNKKLYRDIAEEVNLGQTCYINKETKEFFCIPNFEDTEVVEEAFAAELAQLEEEKEQLIKLEQPDGKAGYKMMEDFVQAIDDFEIQSDFMEALYYERPFASFKQKVRKHSYTSEWNHFRKEKLAELFEAIIAG
jgi:hypothetical protein